jgi:hypothetical protein
MDEFFINDKSNIKKNLLEGLTVSVFTDDGPELLINLSDLDEVVTQKLSIVGITILSMGFTTVEERDMRDYKLFGPFPLPESNAYSVLSVFFNVKPDMGSKDIRISQFGRTGNLWIVFHNKNRDLVFRKFREIENIAVEFIKKIKNESELKEDLFKQLKSSLDQIESEKEKEEVHKDTIPEEISSELINYGFYTISEDESVIPVKDIKSIAELDALIQIDIKNKNITVLKLKENVSQRVMFLAGRAASHLNLENLKSEFKIVKLNDKFDVDFHLKRLQDLISNFA